MAVGKGSLNRVAKSGKNLSEAEIAATVAPAPEAKAKPEVKPAVKATTVKTAPAKETKKVCTCVANKIYGVGDALPVHLL